MNNDTTPLKRCTGCQQWKPATRKYFHKHSQTKDGCRQPCIECRHIQSLEDGEAANERARISWEKHKDRVNAERRAHPEKHREQSRLWRAANRERVRKIKRDWYYANRNKVLAAQKKYQEANPEKGQVIRRRHYLLHPEAYKYQAQKAKHERRAIERNLGSDLTEDQWKRCLDYWGGCCAVCGQIATGLWTTIAMDHWIAIKDPRPDNPGTTVGNIVPLCHGKRGIPAGKSCCNQSKSNKDPAAWLIERLGKRKAKRKLAEIEAYFEWVKSQP